MRPRCGPVRSALNRGLARRTDTAGRCIPASTDARARPANRRALRLPRSMGSRSRQGSPATARSVRGPAITDVTISFAHSHASANCITVRPVFSACAFSVCAIANDSSRNSVSIIRASRRAPRESSGTTPGAYLPVSTPRATGEYGRDADAVIVASRKDLDLRHPVEQVVVRLADDRRRHALRRAFGDDLGDAPAAVVRHAEVADLAAADQVADRADGLGDRRAPVVAVQVVDVDVIGGEPREAAVAGRQHPAPRQAAVVRRPGQRVADLGGEDPALAVRLDRRADDSSRKRRCRRRRPCR